MLTLHGVFQIMEQDKILRRAMMKRDEKLPGDKSWTFNNGEKPFEGGGMEEQQGV